MCFHFFPIYIIRNSKPNIKINGKNKLNNVLSKLVILGNLLKMSKIVKLLIITVKNKNKTVDVFINITF